MAKELGVYPGAIDEFGNRDYFRVDSTKNRKYVAVEDTLIATMPPNFHNGERLGTACLSLLAIAYFTEPRRGPAGRSIFEKVLPLGIY